MLVLRGVLSPFAHPLFTSMTGIGCGLAATSRSPAARVLFVLVGYLAAVTLHALWNGSATLGDGQAFLGVYLYVMVPLLLGMFLLVGWQRRREQRTVRAELPEFAAGRAGSRRARCRCSAASPGATGGGARCAGGRARPRRRPSPSTRRPSRSWRSCAPGCGGGRSARTRGSGTTSGSPTLVAARARAMGQPEALTAAWLRPPPLGLDAPAPAAAGLAAEPVAAAGLGGRAAGA